MYNSYSFHLKKFVLSIFLTVGVEILSGLIIRQDLPIYDSLVFSVAAPPRILFPIVWTVLYVLMGVGLYRILIADCRKGNALYIFFLQLHINFIWPILFFKMRAFSFAFIWLIILIAAVSTMILFFSACDLWAGLLQIPYIIWLIYTAILNFNVISINVFKILQSFRQIS